MLKSLKNASTLGLLLSGLLAVAACGKFETKDKSMAALPASDVSATQPGPKAALGPISRQPAAQADDLDCLKELSEGHNRFKVKISLTGLKKMLASRQKYASRIKSPGAALFVDYSMNSKDKRAYLIDFKSCDVMANEYVIHGGTVYKPKLISDGDTNNDGILDKCINRSGTDKNMTRPGAAVTVGCHQTRETGWTTLSTGCSGVALQGLESKNADLEASGIVLHEHVLIPNNNSIKPVGQGCPAFPKGHLESILKYGSDNGMLVYLYAPQCGS